MNPFLKYATCVFGAAFSAEMLMYFYSKYLSRRKYEICETFFLNEKSGCCWTQKKDCKNKYCMSRVIDRIEKEIDSANSIICIAMYMFTNQRFCDAVIRAKKRGVTVRIIMDYSQRGATGSKLKDFERAGTPCGTIQIDICIYLPEKNSNLRGELTQLIFAHIFQE